MSIVESLNLRYQLRGLASQDYQDTKIKKSAFVFQPEQTIITDHSIML